MLRKSRGNFNKSRKILCRITKYCPNLETKSSIIDLPDVLITQSENSKNLLKY